MKVNIETTLPVVEAAQTGLSSSDWIAISSALIALIALCYSFYQGYLQRRHNELSSKPMLELAVANNTTILSIRNEGYGPAIVTEFTALIHGEAVDLMTDSGLHQFLDAAAVGVTEEFEYVRQLFLPGTVFGPGKEIVVVAIKTELSRESKSSLLHTLHSIPLSIKYKCIYDIEHTSTCNFSKAPIQPISAGHLPPSPSVPSVPNSGLKDPSSSNQGNAKTS